MYLVAPDAGFFGNKIVKSILHFGICRDEQQQIPHTQRDPGGNREREEGEAHLYDDCKHHLGAEHLPAFVEVGQLVEHLKHITHQRHDDTRQGFLLRNTQSVRADVSKRLVTHYANLIFNLGSIQGVTTTYRCQESRKFNTPFRANAEIIQLTLLVEKLNFVGFSTCLKGDMSKAAVTALYDVTCVQGLCANNN